MPRPEWLEPVEDERLPDSPYPRATRQDLRHRCCESVETQDEIRLTNRMSKQIEVWKLASGFTDLFEQVAVERRRES